MSRRLKVVGLGGSFRPNTSSARILELAIQFLNQRGHDVYTLLLSELRLPPFETSEQLSDYPPSVHVLLDQVRSANALIFSTPVYHGTLSGGMKNAIDFMEYLAEDTPPYLSGKVIGLMSASGGLPGINAINSMDYVCRALHGWVCPTTVALPNSKRQFNESGELTNEKLMSRIRRMSKEIEFAATRFALPAPAREPGE